MAKKKTEKEQFYIYPKSAIEGIFNFPENKVTKKLMGSRRFSIIKQQSEEYLEDQLVAVVDKEELDKLIKKEFGEKNVEKIKKEAE